MRARNIKPGFFENEDLGDLSPMTRLLFIGLWLLADREGRLEDRPGRIKGELFRYDDITKDDVDAMLGELDQRGFIQRYQVEQDSYIQVTNFAKHQNPHIKEKPSEIPAPDTSTMQAPDQYHTSTVQAPYKHSSCPADSLIPDSLIPDSPIPPYIPQGDPVPSTGVGGSTTRLVDAGESLTMVQTANGSDDDTSVAHSTTLQLRFDEFWSAYPKKIGKKAAQTVWKKIKPTADLHARILAAVEHAKTTNQWRKDNGQYIPNPTTWLNQGRWDDEYETPSSPISQPNPVPNRFLDIPKREDMDWDALAEQLRER